MVIAIGSQLISIEACPFCGAYGNIETEEGTRAMVSVISMDWKYRVVCGVCESMGAPRMRATSAITIWNSRKQPYPNARDPPSEILLAPARERDNY